MSNYFHAKFDKMTKEENFKYYKRPDMKVGYKLKLYGEKTYSDRRIISKILTLDENNQYGYAMTRPLPTSCIKPQKKVPTWKQFNLMLKSVDLDNKFGFLIVADIRFNKEEATLKQYMYNEIYCPILEKKTIVEATERSVFQDDDKSYLCTKKTHANMFEKQFTTLFSNISCF